MFRKEYAFQFVVVFYLVGMALFLLYAKFRWDVLAFYNAAYYLWDKGKDILLWWALFLYVKPSKELRLVAALLVAFSSIRLIWQICAIRNYLAASNPTIILSLFSIDIIIMCLISIKPQFSKKSKWP